jgi:hypothetical protein
MHALRATQHADTGLLAPVQAPKETGNLLKKIYERPLRFGEEDFARSLSLRGTGSRLRILMDKLFRGAGAAGELVAARPSAHGIMTHRRDNGCQTAQRRPRRPAHHCSHPGRLHRARG